MTVEGTKLLPNLYQGSRPTSVAELKQAGVDLLVLCAIEIQPSREQLRGVRYLRCPLMDDGTINESMWDQATRTAKQVAREVARGKKVLVTCAEGRNRSGLVSGIAVHLLTGAPGYQVADYIQARRPTSLTNEAFRLAICRNLMRRSTLASA